MKPQSNEPCNSCALWNNGCEHYNSSSMRIFGFCGHFEPIPYPVEIKQRDVSYGELAALQEVFEEQAKDWNFYCEEHREQCLLDFQQQYIDGDDNPKIRDAGYGMKRVRYSSKEIIEAASKRETEFDMCCLVNYVQQRGMSKSLEDLIDEFEDLPEY